MLYLFLVDKKTLRAVEKRPIEDRKITYKNLIYQFQYSSLSGARVTVTENELLPQRIAVAAIIMNVHRQLPAHQTRQDLQSMP